MSFAVGLPYREHETTMADLHEHAPLSGLDELPIHQSNEPLRLVAATDPRAFERYWFTAQADDGEFFIVAGIGTYPNLGTVDAYALIVTGDQHTTVRAYRPMSQHREDLSVGPLRFEVVDAFREWRLTLGDNAEAFSFDLRWRDSKRAVFRRFADPGAPGILDFRLLHNWCGYETFGRIEGTVSHQGRTIPVRAQTTRGSRDHHWGTRDGVGGMSLGHARPFTSYKGEPVGFSHLGQWVEFKDWSIWDNRVLFNLGDSAHPGALRIEPIEQRLRFDPETRHLIGGVIVNKLPNGERREVHYEAIGRQCAYLRTAGYEGCNGLGTPNGNLHHGMRVGERVEGETYDLREAAVRMRIEGFEDLLVRATCNGETTVGILESRNPAVHAMASRGVLYSMLD
jgi:hypothetical protein